MIVDILPYDGNVFLEVDITPIGKNGIEKEGDTCSQYSNSSLSFPILDGILGCNIESNCNLTCEDTMEKDITHNTFLYYIFSYDDTHA